MKKKILAFALVALIGGLSVVFLNACDKDTNCYVQVTVLDQATNRPVSGVFVKIDMDSSYVKAEGKTDLRGIFNATFAAPAIYNVNAILETGYDSVFTPDIYYCYRQGSNTIRLKEGDTVFSTVILESAVQTEYR